MSPYTLDDLRRMLPYQVEVPEDRAFMLAHMTPMSRREGLRRAPYLTGGGETSMLVGNELTGERFYVQAWSHFYSCDRFDPETRRCTDYEHRPPMCREYPLYGDSIDSRNHAAKALPDGCVYLPDPVRR